MKTFLMAAAAALSLTAGATAAHADTLTFSDLTQGCYGYAGACPLLPNMTQTSNSLNYTSGAYVLSFFGGSDAHIGDGTYNPGTYNWHDGPANVTGSVVQLSRIDGAAFNLTSFDYSSDAAFAITATGTLSLGLAAGSGTASPNFANVQSVSFRSLGFRNQLDNIVVTAATGAVPEPATWAMMIAGFGLVGGAMRRRSTKIAFA